MVILSPRYFILLFAVLCCWGVGGNPAYALDAETLRALFVTRIVNYVEWPESQDSTPSHTVIIAAADARALRMHIGHVEGVEVVQWPVDSCHVLYFNAGNPREIKAVLDAVKTLPILTIGQDDDFLDAGGMVNLREQGGRLRLEIAPQAATAAGLSLSARLLSVAVVRDSPASAPHAPRRTSRLWQRGLDQKEVDTSGGAS